MSLEYLFSPTKQFTYPSGKLLDGGKVYVYFKDTTDLATLYSPEGSFVSNPILLDANGRASVRADIEYQYRLEIYTNKDVLLYTCEAFCEGDGSGGFGFVIHDETLSGNGTASNPLGVINIPLAVEDSLTAYEDIVEGKNSLVLGVNGDWFTDTFGSALNDKVDWSSFSACCSAVKGGLDNKLDISAFDLSNYYNKQETNNLLDQRVDRYEFAQTMNWVDQTKQDKLEFGYDENSAISSINNSALAGGQGGGGSGDCPWISGAKILADTQTLTDNMIVQVLSSFTLSGNKNHCIAVKGGTYRFPNAYELGDRIATTNYFMANSAMSSYLPFSSFSSYTASIQNSLNSNWDYTTSAYNLSLNNYYNKLDASAFSAYTANAGETYTLVGGNDISISSDDVNQTTTISFTGSTGDVEVNTTVQNNSATWNEVTNKLDASSYHELTAGTNIDIQGYIISGKDWTNEIREASANAFNESTAANPTSSTQWNSCYETVNTNSGDWNKVSAKLDISSFEAYTANDETYLLKGGYNIGVSSDDVNKETTIYYTGTNGDEQVNQVVRQYSAAGTWLTAHQDISNLMPKSESANFYPMTGNPSGFLTTETDWTNTITAASSYAYSQATAQIPAPFDPTYMSGQIDNKLNKSDSAKFYPMTGNPSGFLTAHQSLTNYYTKTETSSKQQISAALQYISANAGKTYSGIDPIVVNNTTNQISADTWSFSAGNGLTFTDDYVNKVTRLEVNGEELSAGPNIDIFSSGDYVVISANGGNTFPITGTDGTSNFTANANCSSFTLTTAQGAAGCYVNLDAKNVLYESYPSTTVSARWYDILNKANEASSNCYCIKLNNVTTSVDLANYSAYDKVTVVHGQEYGDDYNLYWDGKTKVIHSASYCELVKVLDNNNNVKWTFTTSGWTNDNWWDWD